MAETEEYQYPTYYKFLNGNRPIIAVKSKFRWATPVLREDGGYDPGRWHKVRGEIEGCARGLHVSRPEHLWMWVGENLYEAQIDPRPYKTTHWAYGRKEHPGVEDLVSKLCAKSARLVRPVELWDEEASHRLTRVILEASVKLARETGLHHRTIEMAELVLNEAATPFDIRFQRGLDIAQATFVVPQNIVPVDSKWGASYAFADIVRLALNRAPSRRYTIQNRYGDLVSKCYRMVRDSPDHPEHKHHKQAYELADNRVTSFFPDLLQREVFRRAEQG